MSELVKDQHGVPLDDNPNFDKGDPAESDDTRRASLPCRRSRRRCRSRRPKADRERLHAYCERLTRSTIGDDDGATEAMVAP